MLHQDGMAFGSLDGQQNSVLFGLFTIYKQKPRGSSFSIPNIFPCKASDRKMSFTSLGNDRHLLWGVSAWSRALPSSAWPWGNQQCLRAIPATIGAAAADHWH